MVDEGVRKLVESFRGKKGFLIPLLQGLQHHCGYLPADVLEYVAEELRVPLAEIYGVCTFYAQFHLKPRGRHIIRVCRGTACHVRGSLAIMERLKTELHVAENGTTVLVSSHNLRELEDVCDHVGIMNHGKMLMEHSLSELQDNIMKVQLALPDGVELPGDLDIMNASSSGRLQVLILRGKAEEVTNKLAAVGPLFMDVVPLTLEEIFIYELRGVDDAVRKNVL